MWVSSRANAGWWCRSRVRGRPRPSDGLDVAAERQHAVSILVPMRQLAIAPHAGSARTKGIRSIKGIKMDLIDRPTWSRLPEMDDELTEACREWLAWCSSQAMTQQAEEDALVAFVRTRERKARTRALEASLAEALYALQDAIKK